MRALRQDSNPKLVDELEFGCNDTPETMDPISNERYMRAYVTILVMEIGCQRCQCLAFPGRTSNDVEAQGFATRYPAPHSMHWFVPVIARGSTLLDKPRRGPLKEYEQRGTEPRHLNFW